MTRTMRSHELHVPAWLSASELQPHIDGFISYIRECGYSQSTLRVYRNAIAHFAYWMTANKITLRKCRLQYSLANHFNNLSLDFARGLKSKRLRQSPIPGCCATSVAAAA
jgi:hypothetical protein